jgi:propanol-preferring alcohol dehydrogenase
MKAYRLTSPAPVETSPLRLTKLSVPKPKPGQVRIRISVCGVCRTDLHTVEGEIHPPALPVTPGHQVVGVVEAFGSPEAGAQKLELGQRVGVPWLHSACGTCDYCQRGQENLCPNAKFTGFHVHGGYAEYMLADTRYVLPIPDQISDTQAAPLLCAGIVGYRALKKAEVQPGEHVGLFGFGASAHLCLQVLKKWGCQVSVFTRAFTHQEHALELGATWAGSAGQHPGKSLDRAVIFAPEGRLVVRALELIRPGGAVSINAIHMSEIPAFPYEKLYGERKLLAITNATYQDGVEFLTLAATLGLKSTVSLYPLIEVNRALQDLKTSRFNGEAVLDIVN